MAELPGLDLGMACGCQTPDTSCMGLGAPSLSGIASGEQPVRGGRAGEMAGDRVSRVRKESAGQHADCINTLVTKLIHMTDLTWIKLNF